MTEIASTVSQDLHYYSPVVNGFLLESSTNLEQSIERGLDYMVESYNGHEDILVLQQTQIDGVKTLFVGVAEGMYKNGLVVKWWDVKSGNSARFRYANGEKTWY